MPEGVPFTQFGAQDLLQRNAIRNATMGIPEVPKGSGISLGPGGNAFRTEIKTDSALAANPNDFPSGDIKTNPKINFTTDQVAAKKIRNYIDEQFDGDEEAAAEYARTILEEEARKASPVEIKLKAAVG